MKSKWFPGLAVGVILGCILAFGLGAAIHSAVDLAFNLGLVKPQIEGYKPAVELTQGCGVVIYPNDGFGPRTLTNVGKNAEGAIVLLVTDQTGSIISGDQVWEGADYWQWQTRFVTRGSKIWYLESLESTYRPDDPTCR